MQQSQLFFLVLSLLVSSSEGFVSPSHVAFNRKIAYPPKQSGLEAVTIPSWDAPIIKTDISKFFGEKTPDYKAFASHISATLLQFSLIMGFLHPFQKFLSSLSSLVPFLPDNVLHILETAIVSVFFFGMSVRSRVFSPLDNSRPSALIEDPVFKERLRPSWQPPPIAFPVIWTTIALLRTVSSTLVWKSKGTLLSRPLAFMMLHLSIGDTWNTINNVEKRLGTAALYVQGVWISVLLAVFEYYKAVPLAGVILSPSALWLTVANFLVFTIWRLNSELFDRPSLFPSTEEGPSSKWRLPFTSWNK